MRSWPTSATASWTKAEPPVVVEPGTPLAPGAASDSAGRADLMAAVADRVGSTREAGWIVDHAISAGDPTGVRAATLALADRRAAGEPLQYVLGTWAFRSLELA